MLNDKSAGKKESPNPNAEPDAKKRVLPNFNELDQEKWTKYTQENKKVADDYKKLSEEIANIKNMIESMPKIMQRLDRIETAQLEILELLKKKPPQQPDYTEQVLFGVD